MNISDKTSIEIEEYKAIRTELLECNKNSHNVLNWGFSLIILIVSGGLASSSLPNIGLIRIFYFLIVVPIFIFFIFTFWFGEIVRQQRAEKYLCELEENINKKEGYLRLFWHHNFLRRKDKSPLIGFQYVHYANIALIFLLFIFLSEFIALWLISKINLSINEILLYGLFPLGLSLIFLFIFKNKAKKYFYYNLFAQLFNLPWLSFLFLFIRTLLIIIINLNILGKIDLNAFLIVYIFLWVIVLDMLDGKLVRLYAPKYALKFRIYDSSIDILSLTITVYNLYIHNMLPFSILFILLVRELLIIIGVIYKFVRNNTSSIVVNNFGRLFYIFSVVIVCNSLINNNMNNINNEILLSILAIMSFISIVFYIKK